MAKERTTPGDATVSPEPPINGKDNSLNPPELERAPFDINAVIGWILQGGVMFSSLVILIGLILSFFRAAPRQFLVFPHTLGDVWSGLLVLEPQAIIALGLLLLLATPVVRVAASIVAFGLEHDWRYVVITSIVLTILFVSFLLGKGAG